MDIIHSRCAGIDVHKKNVVVCVRADGKKRTRTFKTYVSGLREMGAWLSEMEVTTVAMESTGIYWRPIWNLLEEEFSGIELMLANAEHVKQVPGRKTDVKDAEWLADLHSSGLIRGSRVPNRDSRELQDLARARRKVVQDRTRALQRLEKVLEAAGIKLTSVVSSITLKSSMKVVRALSAGETEPTKLLELTHCRLRAHPSEILAALAGSMSPLQMLLLKVELDICDTLTTNIELLEQEIDERMRPFEESVKKLDELPGISTRSAQEILIYAGPTLEGFPSAGHLSAWTGLCPGNEISAGKAKHRKARKGNVYLKSVMVEAAWNAVRKKGSFFRDFYHRKKATRGAQKAIVAVAHRMMVTIFNMVTRGTEYKDLGEDFHKRQKRKILLKRRLAELKALGYEITGVRDVEAAA